MRIALAVVIYFVSISSTIAQSPSFLAICHPKFPCDGVYRAYDGQQVITLSWLENTFGSKCKCLGDLLKDSREKVIRAHLIQSPCMRNNRCGKYEALYGYTARTASKAIERGRGTIVSRYKRILGRFKRRLESSVNISACYVSPCLECDLYERARRILASYVSTALPNCYIVDNPYRRRCIRGFICEKHGTNPSLSAPCIIDLDGIDGSKINLKNWIEQYQHCALSFYWEPYMNCAGDTFVDPRLRSCLIDSSIFEKTRNKLCPYYYPLLGTC